MTVRETPPACPALPVQPLAWSRTFPATPLQVREARRFLPRVLDGRPAADDAALCLGEVAANASIHSRSRAGGHFTVRAQIYGGRVRREGPAGPPPRRPARARVTHRRRASPRRGTGRRQRDRMAGLVRDGLPVSNRRYAHAPDIGASHR